jgi:hypothetical protein
LPPLDAPYIPPTMRISRGSERNQMREIIRKKIVEKQQKLNNLNLERVKEDDNETSVNETPKKKNASRKYRGFKLKSSFKGRLNNLAKKG